MGRKTGITWTDSTHNLWIGCTKVGPGCDHCYAEAGNQRWSKGANWGPGAPRARTSEQYRRQLLNWNRTAQQVLGRPRRVFINSWSDIFDNEAEQAWRDEFWPIAETCHNIEFQLVTKRVGNAPKMVPQHWMERGFPRNVIVIATVVDQDELTRDWPKLRALPCRRGLSVEPQLGPVTLQDVIHPGELAWAIGGGESHQREKARPYHLFWARRLIADCAAIGAAYFQKQLGGTPLYQWDSDIAWIDKTADPRARAIKSEWPSDLQVQEFPAP